MRVTFSPGSIKSLKEVMASEVNYLDFYITRGIVYITSYTSILYTHKSFKVTSISDFTEPVAIRIHKKDFLATIMEGTVSIFTDQSTTIEVTAKSVNGMSMTFECDYQASNQSSLDRYREILSYKSKFNKLNLDNVSKYARTIRSIATNVDLLDDIAHTETKNIACFLKADCINFALASSELLFLLRHTSEHSMYQNFVIGEGEDVTVICKQKIPRSYSDYEFVTKSSPHYIITLDTTSLAIMSSKLAVDDTVTVDFERGTAYATTDTNSKLSVSLDIKSIKKRHKKQPDLDIDNLDLDNLFTDAAPEDEDRVPKLDFPSILFSSLIPSSGVAQIKMQICYANIIIRPLTNTGGVTFVSGRNESKL